VSGATRVVAVVSISLALIAPTPATPASGDPRPAPAQVRRAGQWFRITVLPPIAQPGQTPASVTAARSVLQVLVRPRQPGRPVHLECKHGHVLDSARLDRRGRATFTATGRANGPCSDYRVAAASYGGLPDVRSHWMPSRAWGAPSFVDEFDGDSLGPAWEHRIQFYNPWGGRSCSKGDPSAVSVGGGLVSLSVLADPARESERCTVHDAEGNVLGDYRWRLNANVSTQHSMDFLYGVAAARIRFQRPQGQHGAFWLQPRGLLDTGPTPWGAEIDVAEYYGSQGRRGILSSSVHQHPVGLPTTSVGGRVRNARRFLEGKDDRWWRNFHVFSVEWTPSEYVFRVDGQATLRTAESVSHDPEFLILSMLSSDYELGRLGDESRLPQQMDVDWVQVWPAAP
jgi:hypothetical protein